MMENSKREGLKISAEDQSEIKEMTEMLVLASSVYDLFEIEKDLLKKNINNKTYQKNKEKLSDNKKHSYRFVLEKSAEIPNEKEYFAIHEDMQKFFSVHDIKIPKKHSYQSTNGSIQKIDQKEDLSPNGIYNRQTKKIIFFPQNITQSFDPNSEDYQKSLDKEILPLVIRSIICKEIFNINSTQIEPNFPAAKNFRTILEKQISPKEEQKNIQEINKKTKNVSEHQIKEALEIQQEEKLISMYLYAQSEPMLIKSLLMVGELPPNTKKSQYHSSKLFHDLFNKFAKEENIPNREASDTNKLEYAKRIKDLIPKFTKELENQSHTIIKKWQQKKKDPNSVIHNSFFYNVALI